LKTRLVESSGGPARKYYSLTSEGMQAMRFMNERFDVLVAGVRSLNRGVSEE
jgi:DNA-binding PadR family transcriptional regulator